jgi:magnesium-transporting ATPase (P-type)
MLTGDKMETAENIAKSCKLIQPGFEIMRLKLEGKLPGGRKDSMKVKEQMHDSVKSVVL